MTINQLKKVLKKERWSLDQKISITKLDNKIIVEVGSSKESRHESRKAIVSAKKVGQFIVVKGWGDGIFDDAIKYFADTPIEFRIKPEDVRIKSSIKDIKYKINYLKDQLSSLKDKLNMVDKRNLYAVADVKSINDSGYNQSNPIIRLLKIVDCSGDGVVLLDVKSSLLFNKQFKIVTAPLGTIKKHPKRFLFPHKIAKAIIKEIDKEVKCANGLIPNAYKHSYKRLGLLRIMGA